MNSIKFLCITLLFAPACFAVQSQKIKLTNPVLQRVDGVIYLMDGHTIRDVLHVRREGRKLQHGVPNKQTRTMVGSIPYEGKSYSVHQLAQKEQEVEDWYESAMQDLDRKFLRYQEYEKSVKAALETLDHEVAQQRAKILDTFNKGDQRELEEVTLRAMQALLCDHMVQKRSIKQDSRATYAVDSKEYKEAAYELKLTYDAKMASLKEALKKGLSIFKDINRPYLEQVHGTKHFLLRLVVESCMKRYRYDSFLLRWAEVPEGSEFEELDKTMTSLRILDTFLDDLSNFFEDLVHSCPRGWNQYLDLVKKQ